VRQPSKSPVAAGFSRPKLAICVYHVPDHLWRIPMRLKKLLPDSRLALRTHNGDGFDCVCYCTPN
jgi:hypothetical protein